jgi:hypothetical protein
VEQDLVTLWAVDKEGKTLRAVGGGLPAAGFGEESPGVPAAECWCYPQHSDKKIEVGFDFDPEETFTP